jgi:hypothetical protein
LMSLIICSDDDGRPAGFCLISTPQVRMNKNTLLNQNYICSIGADVIQQEVNIIHTYLTLLLLERELGKAKHLKRLLNRNQASQKQLRLSLKRKL